MADAVSELIHVEDGDLASGILAIDYRHRHLLDKIAELMHVDFHHYLSTQRPCLSAIEVHALLDVGFTIGVHSIDHPRYASLSVGEQLEQTVVSVVSVSERFGREASSRISTRGDSGGVMSRNSEMVRQPC